MEEYKSNSHKSKEERNEIIQAKNIKKVVQGSVKVKNKNGISKLAGIFTADDIDAAKRYVFEDIVVPAIKDVLLDSVKVFLGVNGSRDRTSASKVSYRSYYDKENSRTSYSNKSRYDYDDVVLNSRGEAEEVLSRMDELMSVYGLVSVADFYDLVGVAGNYTDNKYGWTNIRSASVVRVRDGYMIKLPRALPLN